MEIIHLDIPSYYFIRLLKEVKRFVKVTQKANGMIIFEAHVFLP